MWWQFGICLLTFRRNTLGYIPEEINNQVKITFPERQQIRHSSSISCLRVHFFISGSFPDYMVLNNDKDMNSELENA
jgi:hypothetical protein